MVREGTRSSWSDEIDVLSALLSESVCVAIDDLFDGVSEGDRAAYDSESYDGPVAVLRARFESLFELDIVEQGRQDEGNDACA
mmetsp:Transcript_23224/g.28793  ORF Transcript_23224/g.28793 Transcript_23224/m.28793 type:complete len:83 (-) Transcript_23224:544-792(-)